MSDALYKFLFRSLEKSRAVRQHSSQAAAMSNYLAGLQDALGQVGLDKHLDKMKSMVRGFAKLYDFDVDLPNFTI